MSDQEFKVVKHPYYVVAGVSRRHSVSFPKGMYLKAEDKKAWIGERLHTVFSFFEPSAVEMIEAALQDVATQEQYTRNKLASALAEISKSEKITQTAFKDLRVRFNDCMSFAWGEIKEACRKDNSDKWLDEIYWIYQPESHTFAATEKKLNAILEKKDISALAKTTAEKGLQILADNKALLNRVMSYKNKIGQRGECAPAEHKDPVQVFVSSATGKKVEVMLSEMAQEHKAKLIESYTGLFNRTLADYTAISTEEFEQLSRGQISQMMFFVSMFFDCKRGETKFTRHAHTDEKIQQEAEKQADLVVNRYVFKMIGKLGALVDLMGVPDEIKSSHDSSSGYLEGLISVRYNDGRAYTAKTSLEWSHSIYGKPFTRFPCRFKGVFAAGGALVKRAMSEAEMIEWARSQAK